MSVNIQTVDYEAIPGIAKEMRNKGQELNQELKTLYASISNMHNEWYGKRYNELVKDFNALIPALNEILELVVGTFPYSLETVANNYSQADRGTNATNAVNTPPTKITNIDIINDVGMRYLKEEVATIKESVSRNLKNSESKMNEIETVYRKITWESEASKAFEAKFTTLKNKIIQSFQDIESNFTTQMNLAASDIQSAESSNTVE